MEAATLTARDVLTQALARHAVGTPAGTVLAEALERAHLRVIDSVGCALAGHLAPGLSELVETAASWGPGPATVIGTHRTLSVRGAALANAALTRAFDFEPVSAEGPGGEEVAAHLSGTSVPVALAEGQRHGATGTQVLEALTLGDDVAARLAVGSGFDVYSGQDNTGTVNVVGSAAVAARLAGLSPADLVAAWGVAVQRAGGSVAPIFADAPTFRLPMAFAAESAVTAVELARAGWAGEPDPLAGRFGFLDRFCPGATPELMLASLGEVYCADRVIKPWSSCRASHPSLEAAARLHGALLLAAGASQPDDGVPGPGAPAPLTGAAAPAGTPAPAGGAAGEAPAPAPTLGGLATQVRDVVVHVTPRTAAGFVGTPWAPGDWPEVAAAFSIPFTTAAALLTGTLLPRTLLGAAEGEVGELARRVRIEPSLAPDEHLTAEVELTLADGRVLRERVDAPLGDRHHSPLAAEAVHAKFLANAELGGHSPASARAALDALLALPGAASLTDLFAALAPANA
jgi:2-methylcitrate dehydratase PrpD